MIREHLPEEEANALVDRMIAMEKARRDTGQVLPPPLKKKELERGKRQSMQFAWIVIIGSVLFMVSIFLFG